MITYKKGPNNNYYCEIKSGHKSVSYDVDGINKGSRNDQNERHDLLLQIVARNFGILHTHVIQLAYELSGMAKRTIEKELSNLEEIGLLESSKEGDNPNALRRWRIFRPRRDFEISTKNEIEILIKNMIKKVTKTEKIYNELSELEKAQIASILLQSVYNIHSLITAVETDVDLKIEKKNLDGLTKQIRNILIYENRDYINGRPLLRKLLHQKIIESIELLNKTLENVNK